MDAKEKLDTHLQTGLTHVCRCWQVLRKDGVALGFTDHDTDLEFENTLFRADTGLSALALQQTTGLAVDNTEALGALSDGSLSHADIEAGRYDHAEVVAWLVNWQDVAARKIQFRGHIGEIQRGSGAFTAELRGLTDVLNQPTGRVYQSQCSAVFGDSGCRLNPKAQGMFFEGPAGAIEDGRRFEPVGLSGYEVGWFERGLFEVLTGEGKGLSSVVKRDEKVGETRILELWEPIRAAIAPDDMIRVTVGCDKQFTTCCSKFANAINFQGFPNIPGEDWLMASPVAMSARSRS